MSALYRPKIGCLLQRTDDVSRMRLGDVVSSSSPQRDAPLGIMHQREDRIGDCDRIAWRHEKSGAAVLDNLRHSARVGANDPATCCHGFHADESRRFPVAGKNANVRTLPTPRRLARMECLPRTRLRLGLSRSVFSCGRRSRYYLPGAVGLVPRYEIERAVRGQEREGLPRQALGRPCAPPSGRKTIPCPSFPRHSDPLAQRADRKLGEPVKSCPVACSRSERLAPPSRAN